MREDGYEVVYLPVFHDGALLAIGDLHAAMGDGEAAGCGIEISGCVTLKIDVMKDKAFPTPMIEADGKIITVASAASLDEAADKSVGMMLDYMMNHCSFSSDLAWKCLSAMGEVKICQFANKIKTVRCEMTKHI